jgi:hypothetical protein
VPLVPLSLLGAVLEKPEDEILLLVPALLGAVLEKPEDEILLLVSLSLLGAALEKLEDEEVALGLEETQGDANELDST